MRTGWALLSMPLRSTRLEAYEQLLAKYALPMGMVARSDGSRIRERHIVD